MTKRIALPSLIISLLFLSIQAAKAQYYQQDKNISLGLTFAPNMGFMSYGDSDHYDSKSKFGYAYGLIADLGFARNYYFSTGLTINTLYAERNANLRPMDDTDPSIPADRTYRLQYVEVPLAIKLKTNEGMYGRFYGQFGFTAGVNVSGKEQIEGSTKYSNLSGDDIFRLGLIIGAGAEWRISNSLAGITGITYNNGFTRTMKDGSPKLSYLSLNLGLLF